MGAFLSLLGGISKGAGDTYSKIAEDQRQEKATNNRLAAEAIYKDLITNDQHTPDEQEALQRQYFKLLGVNNKVTDAVVQASHYHRQAMQENARQQAFGQQQPELQGPPEIAPATTLSGGPGGGPDGSGGPDGAPDVSLPPMPMAPTAGIPQLPPPSGGFQPKTAGQLAFEESEPRIKQAEQDKADAARQAARNAAIGTIDDKLDILKKYDGTPMEAEVRQLVGAAPKGVGAKSRALAGTMSGAAVKKELDAQGKDSSDINATSSYRASVDSNGKLLPDSIHETEQQTRAGAAALGSSWNKLFPNDAVGNPINPDAMYVPIRSVNGGQIISVYPVSELGSAHAAQNFKTVQMKDGTTALVPVTETSTTTKTVNGQPVQNTPGQAPPRPQGATPATAQVAPPVPPVPGAAALPGQAPAPSTAAPPNIQARPTPGQPLPRSATPSTPLPQRGGGVGAPIALPGAGKSYTPDQVQANQGLYQAVGTTENRLQQVLNNEDLLNNPVSAARIKAAMSQDTIAQALSRVDGLTQREAKAAALFKSLKEDINVIRKQYNATAFRGPQALEAMQGVAGDPLSNPDVTIQTIKQTKESLDAQKKVIESAMKSHGVDLVPYSRPSDSYKSYAKNPKNGHVIGTDDGTVWYDVSTGEAIK